MSKIDPELLLVVPIYNEAPILKTKLDILHEYLINSGINFHLVLSVDYSGDASVAIVEEFSSSHSRVDKIVHGKKMGRGFAVREAWSLFQADLYSFIDVDLATGVGVIKELYDAVIRNGADVFTASRFIPGATVKRPMVRNLVSKVYNFLLRVIFKENIRDHQCGFKIINPRAKEMVLKLSTEDTWFWDAEFLVLATKCGLVVKESPVSWVEEKYKRTSIKRLMSDIGLHGLGIVRLVIKYHQIEKNKTLRRFNFDEGKGS